jgi:uncharacterized delta-60 repeat protein
MGYVESGVRNFVRGHGRRLTGLLLLASALAAATALEAFAAPGALDRAFGGDGKVTSNFTRKDDVVRALALQPDGKIVAAGHVGSPAGGGDPPSKLALERLKPDGTLDPTFGTGGKVVAFHPDYGAALAVAIQADGKIVTAGAGGPHLDFAVSRFNADGILDTTFGSGGKVTTHFPDTSGGWAEDVVIQPDGKIAGGIIHPSETLSTGVFALVRYNTDGTLDSTFDEDGRIVTDMTGGEDTITGVALQSDGKIVVAGRLNVFPNTMFGLARYEADGTLDSIFGEDGKVTTDFTVAHDGASDVLIQSDGRVVAAGFADGRFALARYNTDGTLDVSFSADGNVMTNFTAGNDYAQAVAIQANGRILAGGRDAGKGGRFAFARYRGG